MFHVFSAIYSLGLGNEMFLIKVNMKSQLNEYYMNQTMQGTLSVKKHEGIDSVDSKLASLISLTKP